MILRSTIYSALFAAVAIAASGCCAGRYSGRHGDCIDGGCGVEKSCGQCGDIGCPDCSGPGPIHALKSLFRCGGCCDYYVDEWISDPPYECEPCDVHGHWVGPRCCPPSILNSWRTLWGRRGVGCTCAACLDRPPVPYYGGEMVEGEVIYDGPATEEVIEPGTPSGEPSVSPMPAPQTSSSTRAARRRQIRSHEVYYERAVDNGHEGHAR